MGNIYYLCGGKVNLEITIRQISKIARIILVTIVACYLGIIALLNTPYIQRKVTSIASSELSKLLHTNVHIGNIDMGMTNRLLIDDVWVEDSTGMKMFVADKLSARFEYMPLLHGKIIIHSIQLFGLKIKLEKETPESIANYQFLLDALASNDTTSSPLHLRINSVLIRRGDISHTIKSAETTPGKFNTEHLHINNLNANLSLKALTNDSINATVRQLSFNEQSGFHLKHLALKLVANKQQAILSRFELELPDSHLELDSVTTYYQAKTNQPLQIKQLKGGIVPSYITPRDLTAFVPSLSAFSDRLNIEAQWNGNMDEMELKKLLIASDQQDVFIKAAGKMENLSTGSKAILENISLEGKITTAGMHFLYRNLKGNKHLIPPILTRLEYIQINAKASGPINNLQTQAVLQTMPGKIQSQLTISNKDKLLGYIGSIETNAFDLGKLLDSDEWGKVTFGMDVNGKMHPNAAYPDAQLKGSIDSLQYKGYTYNHIFLNGHSINGGYDGWLEVDDPNGKLTMHGNFNATQPIPVFNLKASLKDFNPHKLKLSDRYEDTKLKLNLTADFKGNSIDNMEGFVSLDSLLMISNVDFYYMERFKVASHRIDNQRNITIKSDFLNGELKGDIHFATLPESFKHIVNRYTPTLLPYQPGKRHKNNNFHFDLTLTNTDLLSKVFYIPIDLHTASTIKGYLNEETNKLKLEGYFPSLEYGGSLYESGMVICDNPADEIRCQLRATKLIKNDNMVSLTAEAIAKNDTMQTAVTWGNNTNITYSGTIKAVAGFFKEKAKDAPLQASIHIAPTQVILNDTVWDLHASHIRIDSGHVFVDKFKFEHHDQHLVIDGKLTDKPSDSLLVNLNKIKLEYVFDILNFHPVDFKGLASGEAKFKQLFTDPQMEADLFVKDFMFENGLMGDMKLLGRWDKDKGIYFDGDIREQDIAQTLVKGYVSPISNSLDLHIQANKTRIDFLDQILSGIFRKIEGRTTGNIHLHGPFNKLNLIGETGLEAHVDIKVLGTDFTLRGEKLKLEYNKMVFDDMYLYDNEGNRGSFNGWLSHNHLSGSGIRYNFRVNPNQMLIYNEKANENAEFYGTVYATGVASIVGEPNSLNIDLNINSEDKTTFVYNSATPEEITSNDFITFVDKTPRHETDTEKYSYKNQSKKYGESDLESEMDIRLNMQIDVNPNANIRVIMNPLSGDYVSLNGNGALRASYYNKGSFNLHGTYTIDHGLYKLSMQEVIRKDFQFQPGGTITFGGDPYEGILDLQAVYTVNSASLNDLVPGANFTQNSVRVNCLMNLTGRILNPEIAFDLELPTVSEEEREMVRSYVSTKEQMDMQIIYLLGIGKFYTYDYNMDPNNEAESTSTMGSLLSTTLSGQLNNMLSQVINSNQWNIGTNLSTGNKGWTDMEVEGILSGRLLNNRLLINGNFGYRDNPMANTNFVGDFDVQWLLTRSGEISLKGYNHTNDRYFTKSTLTTQGIGIIFKKDFSNWIDFFGLRKKKKVLLPTSTTATPEQTTGEAAEKTETPPTDTIIRPKPAKAKLKRGE